MSHWKDFLKKISQAPIVNLVGPLANGGLKLRGPVIYVDGGVRFRSPADAPSISVGDGDSAPLPLDEMLPSAKNFSDLAFALRSLPSSLSELHLYGFLGGRRDHELANFGEVQNFLKMRADTKAIFFSNELPLAFAFSRGDWTLKVSGVFSVFVLESEEVQITGACRYPLAQPTRLEPLSSHGLSNEGSGEVHIVSGGPFFLFLES